MHDIVSFFSQMCNHHYKFGSEVLKDNKGIIFLTIIIFDLNFRIENIDLFLCNKYVHDNRLFKHNYYHYDHYTSKENI